MRDSIFPTNEAFRVAETLLDVYKRQMLKSGLTAKVEIASIPKLPIFDLMQKKGDIPTREMYNTFNMGVGMCIAVAKEQVDIALSALKEADTNAFVMGEVVPGEEGVILC